MIRPELFLAIIFLLLGGTGLVLVIYGLISLFTKGFDRIKQLYFLGIGSILIVIVLLFIFHNPSHKFVGMYVDWDDKASAIELKTDGTFKANFSIEGTKTGKWELIDSDEFYFILLSSKNNSQIGRLVISDQQKPVKLRFVSSETSSKTAFELVKF